MIRYTFRMKKRALGAKGFEVSEVGLGCWQLGANWGEELSRETAFQIMQAAVDSGITFFDTADVYGDGKSERFIGEFIKETKASITVATKFGSRRYVRQLQCRLSGSVSVHSICCSCIASRQKF